VSQFTERQKRAELWNAIAGAIGKTNHGWVVSLPDNNKNVMRVEILEDSPLADVLSERYRLTKAGMGERIVNNAIETEYRDKNGRLVSKTVHPGIVQVAIYFLEY
jgi:hypothetical protein